MVMKMLFYYSDNVPGEKIFRVGSFRYKMDPSRRTLQRISGGQLMNYFVYLFLIYMFVSYLSDFYYMIHQVDLSNVRCWSLNVLNSQLPDLGVYFQKS